MAHHSASSADDKLCLRGKYGAQELRVGTCQLVKSCLGCNKCQQEPAQVSLIAPLLQDGSL